MLRYKYLEVPEPRGFALGCPKIIVTALVHNLFYRGITLASGSTVGLHSLVYSFLLIR